MWLLVIGIACVLGLLTAPRSTADDAAAYGLVPVSDWFAVALVALILAATASSLLAASLQAHPSLMRDAAVVWGVLSWAPSPYGEAAPEGSDPIAAAEAEADVAPLARTIVRAALAASAATAARERDGMFLEAPARVSSGHGDAGGASATLDRGLPRAAVASVSAELVAQRQLLVQGLAVVDPSLRGAEEGSIAVPQVSLPKALRHGGKGGWNPGAEVVGRTWLALWDGLLGRGSGPDTAARWTHLKAEAAAHEPSRTLQHVRAPAQVLAMRDWVELHLEGPDVFWDGALEDGSEPSASRFGSLTVIEFPWHCLLAYDDCNASVTLWDEDLPALVARNSDPAIGARRLLRRQLRALEGHNVSVPLDRTEQHSIPDGLQTFVDPETGAASATQRHSRVDVKVRYKRGTLRLGRRNASDPFSRGFGVSVAFHDGRGVAQAPKTGEMVELTGLYLEIGAEEAGITPDFDMTETLRNLLWNGGAQAALAKRLPEVEEGMREERARRRGIRERGRWLLDPSFLVDVFAGVGPDVESVESVSAWFRRWRERHGVREGIEPAKGLDDVPGVVVGRDAAVRAILSAGSSAGTRPGRPSPAMAADKTHAEAIAFAFSRMRAITSGGSLAMLWFLAFSDAWRCNNHIPAVQRAKELLDDLRPSSLCYSPMPRGQLEALLTKHKLLGRSRGFTLEALDALFAALGESHAASLLQRAEPDLAAR